MGSDSTGTLWHHIVGENAEAVEQDSAVLTSS